LYELILGQDLSWIGAALLYGNKLVMEGFESLQ
jgi:hypothetical protein